MRTINGIHEKLSKAREVCPNLNEGVYELVDCVGKIACQYNLPAVGLANLVHIVVTDIHDGKNVSLCVNLPDEVLRYKEEILVLEKSIPYVIASTIDDEGFVNEFCKRFNKIFENI